MSSKRKQSSSSDGPTSRERKKQKMAQARNIDVQPTASSSSSAAAGPSASRPDSMKGLPSAIEVERFAEARAFEINAMQEAMESAKGASGHRAWQELPRHLRRRAASHDVRRVPLRLRDKARAEMDPPRPQASRPKRGKANRLGRTESLLKRQRDKTWLESHIWHAKRMHMEDKWGYRLAITPTEKAFRPSHRAAVHGSILHDASYFALIEVKSSQKILARLLEACCDPQGQGPGAKRFTIGARVLDTHIYASGMYPFGLLAPATVLWRPVEVLPGLADINEKTSARPASVANLTTQLDPDVVRTVWVRVHPSAFDAVHEALQKSASMALAHFKALGPQDTGTTEPKDKEYEVEITDLREDVNVFEIMGPKASQVIHGALRPVADQQGTEFKQFWNTLEHLQSAGSIPRGMVIGCTVYDPRLTFPPKNAKVRLDEQQLPSIPAQVATFPTSALAQSSIWDETTRNGLRKPKFTKKDIDERRAKNVVPGTPLSALRDDARIPILLIQRSVEPSSTSQSSSNQPSAPASQALHGWTLIFPAGWGMPFLSSLVHTGTRVGGLRERQVQAFEAARPCFPRDYAGTTAETQEAHENAAEEQRRWDRRPKAKRVNYEKAGVASPFLADWVDILGIFPGRKGKNKADASDLVATQRDEEGAMDVEAAAGSALNAGGKIEVGPWLFCGPEIRTVLSPVFNLAHPEVGFFESLNTLRAKRNMGSLNDLAWDVWMAALVNVQLVFDGRGAPDDLAIIYGVGDEEGRRWREVERQRKGKGKANDDENVPGETELGELAPSESDIIGVVTSGNFSLSAGHGSAIGAVSVAQLHEIIRQAQRLDGKPQAVPLVKVRGRDGRLCRAARMYLLQ